jgi:hypothetical protein
MKVNNNIVISVGQAGNQIAACFWKSICQEHGIDPTTGQGLNGQEPKGCVSSFFSKLGESSGVSHVPRAIMVDLEPSVLNEVKKQSGSLFNPANIIHRTEGAGGNFAVGYAGEGRELLDEVLTRLESEVAKCDNVGGILFLHSLGGGTGSGLGCLLIESIKQRYPEIPIFSAAILPSPQVSSVVTEPYNTVFALDILKRSADACIVFDNEAMLKLAHDKWNIEEPSLDDLNQLIVEVLTGITASMRFTGFLTVEISMREMITNLVPLPGLHFLTPSFSPLTPPEQSKFEEISVDNMINALFDDESFFAACKPSSGRYMAAAVLYRGVMDDKPQADAALAAMKDKIPLTSWIPTAFKIGYVEQAGVSHRKSTTLLANNTEIARVIERIANNFDKLFNRKAFLNWYLKEGMTEELIGAIRTAVGDLIATYKKAEDSGSKGAKAKPAAASTAAATPKEILSKESSGSVPVETGDLKTLSLKDIVAAKKAAEANS